MRFVSSVVVMPEKVLIPSLVVTLDLLCGCSNNADMVIDKLVQHGDTLLTTCSRFKANTARTAILNRLDNPGRRYFVYPKTRKEK